MREAWPQLRSANVIVTHRNFLANELLAPAGVAGGRIPNGATVVARVRRGRDEKVVVFLRHCTSHHNASARGSGGMTTCADVSDLRRLAASVRGLGKDVLIGSSALPRAVLSAIALQRAVSAEELERVRRAFQPEDAANSAEVRAYRAAHACAPGAPGYCSGGGGTFNLAE